MSACVSPPQPSVSHIVHVGGEHRRRRVDGVAALLEHHRAGGGRERLAGDRQRALLGEGWALCVLRELGGRLTWRTGTGCRLLLLLLGLW